MKSFYFLQVHHQHHHHHQQQHHHHQQQHQHYCDCELNWMVSVSEWYIIYHQIDLIC